MRARRRFAIAVSAALAVSVTAAGNASAHTVWNPTQLPMHYSWDEATGHFFSGSVSSARLSCTIGRSITLYRRVGTSSVAVAHTTTHEGPHWGFSRVNASPGQRYYAVVARKVIRWPGHKHVCRATWSGEVPVPPPGT